ncbi:TPA: GTP-binding protein [Legionella pneumophila]|nr:GTP-binding protein [Legionella pneumophila]HEM7051918.1 GTP-binding protein [Legionella pneumophila]HEM7061444.1 GTP-binding protein [Legionella pneumophila]HEM7077472.1 GTP-binding protein [Legionella pneumophila]HEM7098121.1 GTP-binding protein [Legionella pneumophila]
MPERFKNAGKILVLGDAESGKSCLINRYANHGFTDTKIYTLGQYYYRKDIEMFGETYTSMIYDTDKNYDRKNEYKDYRDADAIIIAFDLTRIDSLSYAINKFKEIIYIFPLKQIVFAGTKSDLNQKLIPDFEIQREVTALKIPYFATSAKTGENVDEAFYKAIELTIQTKPEYKLEGRDKKIVDALDKYIQRVNGKYNDFIFPFFKMERGIQRQANCGLAKRLKQQVESGDFKISDIFSDDNIEKLRNNVIKEESLYCKPGYRKTGINSSELNSIIRMAQEYQNNQAAMSKLG